MIQIIDLIFSFINLAIVIALGTYAFIRFIKPGIKQEIHTQIEEISHLKTERVRLIEKQSQLEQEILEQEKLCKQLKEKVSFWRDVYTKDKQDMLDQTKQLQSALKDKIAQQSHNYQLDKMQKQIAHTVYSTLETDLEKYFTHDQHTESYFNTILKKIKSDA